MAQHIFTPAGSPILNKLRAVNIDPEPDLTPLGKQLFRLDY